MHAGTLIDLLELRARELGDRPFLRFATGDVGFREANERTGRLAGGLRALGVAPRELVAVMLPNCADFALIWLALGKLGAVEAPVNTAFRGAGLAHMINVSRARVLVVDASYLDAIVAVREQLTSLQTVIVRGDAGTGDARLTGLDVLALGELEAGAAITTAAAVAPEDLAMLLFTSGTTGRSKGCMLSHRYLVRHAELFAQHLGLREDDVLYCPFPLFHADAAVFTVAPALVLGATAAIGERFSVRGFWPEVRAFGATVFDFMGATLAMLHKQPPRPEDRDNPVRLAWGVPVPDFAPEFEARFDLQLVEVYGLTDAGIVIYQPVDQPRRPGSCGRVVPPFDVRILGDDGRERAAGEVGEIVIRSDEPSLLMQGYYGMPEETLEAFRDLWFHTGDLARRDADGWFYFVGRSKEVIRRRGENISAFEVEEIAGAHPAVLEAAAYGVPSDLTEEEVMVAVVLRDGHTLTPAELVEWCAPQLARHMLPRYVDVLPELPKTPTEKVEKYRLVERGVTRTTWDRERERERAVTQ